jgi:hypothetical protein
MSDTIQVGQRIRVTRIRPVGADVVNEGVIAEIEPEGFADNGKPYPPYAVIEDENGKHVTSFPMAYDGKSIEFTETYHVEILEPAPTPSPVDDRQPSLTATPVESGQIWAWKDEDFANGDPGQMFRIDSESGTPGHWKYGYVGDSVHFYGEGPQYVASTEVIARAATLVQDADDSAQDHGPLAATLSERTLAKVLSRPAHVPLSEMKSTRVFGFNVVTISPQGIPGGPRLDGVVSRQRAQDELDELEPFMVDGWKTVMVELREVTS